MNWAQNRLAQIGEETGGEAYIDAPVSFKPYLAEIAEHLGHQYLVTVLVKPGNKAGFQDVRLATEVQNASWSQPLGSTRQEATKIYEA